MEENRKAIINGFLDITKHWNDPREFLKDNYDKAIWCAIADFTFRTTDRVPESTADKVGMEGLFNALCPENSEDSLKKRFIHYFEEEQREETEFDTWHDSTCGYVLDTLQKMYNVHYGKAQKIVNTQGSAHTAFANGMRPKFTRIMVMISPLCSAFCSTAARQLHSVTSVLNRSGLKKR